MNNQFINGMFPENNYNQRNAVYGTYYNAYPQQVQQPQSGNINTNIQRIQGGPVSVNAIQLPPNSVCVYFDADSESPYFYVKSVDANGRPNLKTCIYFDVEDYQKQQAQIVQAAEATETNNYVTKEQFDEAIEKLNAQMAENLKKLNDFKAKIGNANAVKKENKQ